MADNEVIIELKAKVDSIDKSLKRIEEKSEKTGNKVDKELGDGLGKKLSSGFKKASVAAAVAFAAISAAAVVAGRRVVEASSRQQDAVNQLNQSLIAAGTFSREASQGLQEYAKQIQRTTTLGDEAVLEQLALARTFARSNEEARDLVDAAIELSAATGTELRSAVVNLGKSFSGLTGELGESVGEIRNLTAEELKAGAAIDLIKGKFDGFAAAQTNTFSGAVAQTSNAFGDLQETIGDLITQSPAVVAAFKFIKESIDDLSASIQSASGDGGFKSFINNGLDVARFLTVVLGTAIEGVVNIFKSLGQIIGGVSSAIVQLFRGEFTIAGEIAKESIKGAFSEETFKPTGTLAAVGFIDGFKQSINSAPPLQGPKVDGSATEAVGQATQDQLVAFTEGNQSFLNQFIASFKQTQKQITALSKQTVATLKATFVSGLSNAFASIGSALVKGENAFAAFGKAILGVFGDLAIQLGSFYLALGLANLFLNPAAAAAELAGGAALIAVGGALKALAGAGGGAGAGGEAGAGGGVAGGPVADPNTGLTELQETEQQEPGTVVNVNVQGNVLDRRETGIELVNVINEQFQTSGGVITRRATV